MEAKRCALIFTQDAEGKGNPALREALERVQITPLLPHTMTPAAGRVVIILIERPVENAARVLSNVRKNAEFSKLPALVILDRAESAHASQLKPYGADILFKPVSSAALQRYFERLNGAVPPTPASQQGTGAKSPAGGEQKKQAPAVRLAAKPQPPVERSKSELDAMISNAVGNLERVSRVIGDKARTGASKGGAVEQAVKAKADDGSRPAVHNARPAKEKSLPDDIPNSTMLLSSILPDGEAKKGGVPCEHCRRWKARREDPSCSRCGEPLVKLEMQSDEVTFEPLGEHTVGALLDLRNAGQNSLWLSFKVLADEQLARRFKLHVERAALEGKSARHQLITFDARGLDLTTGYQGALEIVSNERGLTKHYVKLVVERKAAPRVALLGRYVFALGSENVWEFGLANDGGGTLRLKGVRLDAAKADPDGVPLEFAAPVSVKGGQTCGLRLRVPELNLPIGAHTRKIAWNFEHHPPISSDLAFEVKRPPSIAVQPPELDFGVVSNGRSQSLDIELINNGGEELVVESVKPSERAAAWVECKASAPLQLRIPPGGSGHVELLVRGTGLEGEQRGEVVVRSNSFQSPALSVPVGVKFIVPTDYEHYIGIDFGTTASCVAVLDKEFKPTLLEIDPFDRDPLLKGDPRLMPSVLFFHDDGRVIYGRAALNYADNESHKAVTSIKRSLGLKKKKVIAGKEYDAIGVTAQIIEQLLRCTEDGLFQLGQYKTPRKAVLTVPIKFQKSQRDALLEACRIAGLNTRASLQSRNVIDEAQAAALYYFSRKDPGETAHDLERVLIFDWGGGTLDCALTEIGSDGRKLVMKTLALGGDQRLGGEDIDWALVSLLAQKAKQAFPDFDINCLDVEKYDHYYRHNDMHSAAYQTRSRFKRQAEAAKIKLAEASIADVTVTPLLRMGADKSTLLGTDAEKSTPFVMNGAVVAALETTLTRDELDAILSPFLERAVGVVKTLCERASVPPEQVNTILHTGRTSRLPLVRESIKAILPNAADRSELVDQKVCVAMGAAFWGRIKEVPSSRFEFIGAANRLIHDIGYMDFDPQSFREVFVPVFSAQAEFPCEKVIEIERVEDVIKLELYENRGSNRFIRGNPEVSYIKTVLIDAPGTAEERVPVHFALDENGRLEIIVNNQRHVVELDGGD